MLLASIYDLLSENVEGLIPHLKEMIEKGFEPKPDRFGRMVAPLRHEGQKPDLNKAVMWVLKADPRFMRDQKKKKSLAQSNAPYAKYIIKWWIDGEIALPDDVEIVGETLKKFNMVKQTGYMNIDVQQTKNYEEIREIVAAFEGDQEEGAADKYGKMGFKVVMQEGPWTVYNIDKWVEGPASTIYEGQHEHAAFEGASWCVKYKGTFHSYLTRGDLHLVVLRSTKYGLIHIRDRSLTFERSQEFKAPNNSRRTGPVAEQFIRMYFARFPEKHVYLLVSERTGDFAPFIKPEDKELLTPEVIRQAISKSPAMAVALTKRFGDWPQFNEYPEAYNCIINSYGINTNQLVSQEEPATLNECIIELIKARGRLPEMERKISANKDLRNYIAYVRAFTMSSMPYDAPSEEVYDVLINMGKPIIFPYLQQTSVLRNRQWGIINQWGKAAVDMLGDIAIKHFGEIDKMVLDTGMPRFIASWSVVSRGGRRWPEAEQTIAYDPRAIRVYKHSTGVDLIHATDTAMNKSPMAIVNYAINSGQEVPQLEHTVLQDINAAILYSQHVIGPWPELEDLLRKEGTDEQKQRYIREVLYGEQF